MRKWLLAITVLLLAVTSSLAQDENSIPTRFGTLSINDAGKLLFKGSLLNPPFEEDTGLSLSELHQLGDADVVSPVTLIVIWSLQVPKLLDTFAPDSLTVIQ